MYDYTDKIERYARRYESGKVCFDLLQRIPEKYAHFIEDAKTFPDCYMVYLAPGFSLDGCDYSIVAYTIEDLLDDLERVREDANHTGE